MSSRSAHILVAEDDKSVRLVVQQALARQGYTVQSSGTAAGLWKLIESGRGDVLISDIALPDGDALDLLPRIQQHRPDMPVIVMSARSTLLTAVKAQQTGVFEYLPKPFELRSLVEATERAVGSIGQSRPTAQAQPGVEEGGPLVGRSRPMQDIFKAMARVVGTDLTVLITGESGTGKELVARAIYSHSQRSSQPYLAINCAAIPENLLESELFGHEKGAFTGANTQRIGKFEQCDGGTIFLDEIGDMTLATQTKILRVLQNGTFERVGGNQPVKVDVRVIAATNKPLEKAVEEGDFREDLFYRLNVVRIQLPALRERREDIPQLVSYFLSKNSPNPKQPKTVQPDALAKLETHDWPGNVRELENAVQRALVMAKGDAILLENLPPEVLNVANAASPDVDGDDLAGLASKLFRWARNNPDLKVIPAVERELVINALKETDGNQVQSAKLLGITRATLRKRIEKFDIKQGLTVE